MSHIAEPWVILEGEALFVDLWGDAEGQCASRRATMEGTCLGACLRPASLAF